jgi:hypothetical protein
MTTHKVKYLTDIDASQIKAGDTIEVEAGYDREFISLPSQYDAVPVDLTDMLSDTPSLENTRDSTHVKLYGLHDTPLFFVWDINTTVADPSVIKLGRGE